jgi:hypothetical protein
MRRRGGVRIRGVYGVAAVALGLQSVGCNAVSGAGSPAVGTTPDGLGPATLPHQVPSGSCNTEVKLPSLCDWAGRSEAVVLARIIDVAVSRSPYVSIGGDSVEFYDGACSGAANVALRLALNIEEVLWGTIPFGTLTVAIGSDQVGAWNPMPAGAVDGATPSWFGDNPVEPLQPGGSLLLSLTRESSRGEWSTLGEYLYTFDAGGNLVTVDAPCATEAAVLLASPHVDVLAAELAACPTERSDAATKALAGKENWSLDPLVGVAALCFESASQ